MPNVVDVLIRELDTIQRDIRRLVDHFEDMQAQTSLMVLYVGLMTPAMMAIAEKLADEDDREQLQKLANQVGNSINAWMENEKRRRKERAEEAAEVDNG